AFLNDGQRIWLVDWSHGGWNDGLYDLAGLAIHLESDRVAEDETLRHYLSVTYTGLEQAGWRRFADWKWAVLLWLSLWCAIGDMFSDGDVDFAR
ncbi:MAG: choline kinase, partial [Alphaproteobacteria bacterium]